MLSNPPIWQPLLEYEGLYEISNQGEIRTTNEARTRKLKASCILKKFCNKNRNSYVQVLLRNNGVSKCCLVHRLLALNFISNPENKPEVNHINGITSDNRLENLEWVTKCENQQHAVALGLKKPTKGEINGRAKLNKLQIVQIRELYAKGGITQRKIGELYGVSQKCIGCIVTGKTWS